MEVIQFDDLLKQKTCHTPIHIWAVNQIRFMANEKQCEVVLKKGKMLLISVTPEKVVTAAMPLTTIMPVPHEPKSKL